ncbi:MAG: hypothetical protein A2243_11830 [Omnitrophica WOR_2 bacterium RIFOXYA2_FULL_38_17]|nr:MAG: hypothetical protein A2243_11830 [Omnitrophica WOR_2 bacterium RIFOXYA2_FULL_38_17]
MTIEERLNALEEQVAHMAEALGHIDSILSQQNTNLRTIYEGASMNIFIVGHILNDKLEMSREDINRLVGDARANHQQFVNETNEIRKMWEL